MGQARGHDLAEILTPAGLKPVKRSVVVAGHATSVTLEPAFWRELENAARRRDRSLNGLVSDIDAARAGEETPVTLATALRRFVLSELTR